jgi:predicted small lipoprotein YifL
MKKIIFSILILFTVTGCSNKTKKTLGLVETMPDEYQVQRSQPLIVPPHYKTKKVESNKKTDKKDNTGTNNKK